MNTTVLVALIGAAGACLGALATLWLQSRRLASEVKLTEAQAKKTEREADDLIIDNLTDEIGRLKDKNIEIEARLTQAETRATGAEVRLADAETRANEFRRAVIVVGERLDKEREQNRKTIEKLIVIIEHLLTCIEDPSRVGEVDRDAITRLIQTMRENNNE